MDANYNGAYNPPMTDEEIERQREWSTAVNFAQYYDAKCRDRDPWQRPQQPVDTPQ